MNLEVQKLFAIFLFGAAVPASADMLFYSDGSDITRFTNEWNGVGYGGTVASASPFVIKGVSQGSYIAATSYPMAFLAGPVTASAQGIWVGFLMQATAPDTWAGGINLSSDTSLVSRFAFGFAGAAGWWGNSMNIVLGDPHYNTSSGYAVVDGQSVAVLAHFYDIGNSGTFNTGDLYVDSNLAAGVSFDTPIVSGFAMSGGVSSVGSIRLGADPTSPETRYYDNIIITTTKTEAISAVGGVSPAPEPSTLVLAGLGGLGMLWQLRQRK